MDVILFVIVIVVALLLLGRLGRGSSTARADPGSRGSIGKQRILEANDEWLRERWRMADAEQATGNLKHFPKWYFDEPTDSQKYRIEEDGLSIRGKRTKGQYSDIIGLFVEPDDDEREKLKFFGATLKGSMLNQTRARHELAKIDSDPQKQRAWLSRPASTIQKEFYRFIGTKPPAGLTYEQAEAKMMEMMEKLTEAQQDEWSKFEEVVEEFEDRDFRSAMEIRKPSIADIRSAMVALKAEGKAVDDPSEIAGKLILIKPSLMRTGE